MAFSLYTNYEYCRLKLIVNLTNYMTGTTTIWHSAHLCTVHDDDDAQNNHSILPKAII